MARKYLDDVGYHGYPEKICEGDKREEQWIKEREEYGFDERDTWDLNNAFFCWLYERLMMYKEISIVDLSFHKFEYKDKEYTKLELIDKMIAGCELYFNHDGDWWDLTEDERGTVMEVLQIWLIVFPAMWW